MVSLYWLVRSFVRLFVCLGSHSCHHRHYICVFVSKTNRNENCVHFVFIHRLATFRRFHRFMHCICTVFNECEKWHKQRPGNKKSADDATEKMKMKKLLSRFDQMAHTIFTCSHSVDRSGNKIEKY